MMTSGNNAVDALGKMNFTGNVIPLIWCKKICFENGKPNLNAIMILSDIVYWYRPREIRDEDTGAVIGYEKKFKADLLQRSYQNFSEQFGISKRQAKDALDLLYDLGIIYREFRNVDTKNGTLFNVMFIGLNPERLSEITFSDSDECKNAENCTNTNQRRGSYVSSEEGVTTECRREVHSNVGPLTMDERTNTKNTTEITTRDYNPINLSDCSDERSDNAGQIDTMDEINVYREIIKENLEYDIMRARLSDESEKARFDEIYEIICDVVTITKGTVRVGGEEKPCQLVKSVFLKLTYAHVEYVMDCLNKTVSQIGNMRAYLITSLYRATQTMENCLMQQVNHGQYEYARNSLTTTAAEYSF